MSMSLSPRPDNVTTIESDFDLVLAILIACETACADSSAGIIPSVFVNVKNGVTIVSYCPLLEGMTDFKFEKHLFGSFRIKKVANKAEF